MDNPNMLPLARENIFLFIPNLIGYFRIFLTLLACYHMPTNHVKAVLSYILAGLLDAVDGHAARFFNQSTRFGAMLDQLTDRCATMCLLATLSYFYPSYMFFFQLSMTIDIACHWLHLHTSLLLGKTSHKSKDANRNEILQFYYTSREFLFFMCAGNELFYASLYLCYFTYGWRIPLLGYGFWQIVATLTFPVAVFKSILALLQGYEAAVSIGDFDVEERQMQRQRQN